MKLRYLHSSAGLEWLPPKEQVAGSNPAGDTLRILTRYTH